MDQTAPHSARTEHLAPPQGQDGTAIPTCIGAILSLVRTLLGYAKHLDRTLPDCTEHRHFPSIAHGFGTHDLRRILGHVHRGILRAMMLERYLLARAAQGRDIEATPPPGPAEPEEIAALDIELRAPAKPRAAQLRARRVDPDDPMHFSMPTLKELEAQVRSRPIGRTIAEICMDLGIAANMCDGATWTELYAAMAHFGGSFETFFTVQERRRKAFKKERERRTDNRGYDWQDRPKDAIRELLGYLLGESPPRGPPEPEPLTA